MSCNPEPASCEAPAAVVACLLCVCVFEIVTHVVNKIRCHLCVKQPAHRRKHVVCRGWEVTADNSALLLNKEESRLQTLQQVIT